MSALLLAGFSHTTIMSHALGVDDEHFLLSASSLQVAPLTNTAPLFHYLQCYYP